MIALQCIYKGSRFVLETYEFGTYCLYFERIKDKVSTRDDLFNNLADAMEICNEDFGVPLNAWERVEGHTPIMAPE